LLVLVKGTMRIIQYVGWKAANNTVSNRRQQQQLIFPLYKPIMNTNINELN